jgi:hypothetical protein
MDRELADASPNQENQASLPATADRKRNGRRRFIGGAGAAIPVILSVASRSTLACTCLSPSASASINLQNSRPNRDDDGRCAGLSPGYWKTHDYRSASQTKFEAVFASSGTTYSGKTIKEVTALEGNADHEALARHIAAAWCNLTSGKVDQNVLSLADLQAMWNGRGFGYHPVSGSSTPTWYDDQMVEYISTTFYHR